MKVPKTTQQEIVGASINIARKHKLTSKELEARLVEAGCSREETAKIVKEYEDNPEFQGVPLSTSSPQYPT